MSIRKTKSVNLNKVYLFYVSVNTMDSPLMQLSKYNKKLVGKNKTISREIAMLGTHSLYKFAQTIVNSFGFDFDHCFGFYKPLDIKILSDAKEMYELFTDIDEEPNPGAKSVKTSKIYSVFTKIGDGMLFYFDYGDNWHFNVRLQEFLPTTYYHKYPQIIRKLGGDLEQYPTF
jgi:hypothetical protein